MKITFLILLISLSLSTVSSLHAQNPIEDVVVNEDSGRWDVADLNEVFSDIYGDALSFSFVGAPDELNMNIDENGILFFNPDENYNLPDGVEITVTAENEERETTEDAFNLVIRPVNDAPEVVEPIWDFELDQDPGRVDVADLDEVFFDVDGDELTFNFRDAPDEINMDIDENNILYFNPDRDFSLDDGVRITVRAEDPDGAAVEDRFTLVIIGGEGDPPAVVGEIPDIRVNEDSGRVNIVNLDNVFADVNGDELIYSFFEAPDQLNMAINEENILFFNPDENYNLPDGVEITVMAENVWGAWNDDVFNLVINPVNDAPVVVSTIEDVDEMELLEGSLFVVVADLDDVFMDVENDELLFSFAGAPDEFNMDIDDDNVLFFDSEPQYDLPEGAEITVTAEDPDGLTVEDVLTVVIHPWEGPPQVNNPLDDVMVNEDPGRVDIADLNDVFFDVDGDVLVFSFAGAPDELNMEIDEDGIFFFNPDENYNLPDGVDITVTAENDEGEMVAGEFNLVIRPVNDAPVVREPIEDMVLDEDPGRIDIADLDDVFFDVDGDELSYSVEGAPEELNMDINDENVLFLEADMDFNLPNGVDITVSAEDPDGETVEDIFIVTITGEGPHIGVLQWIEDVVVDEDPGRVVIVDLDEVFISDDGGEIWYSIWGVPDELRMAIDENNVLFFNPVENFYLPDGLGITVSAENREGASAEVVFMLVINPVNDAPEVVQPIDDFETDERGGARWDFGAPIGDVVVDEDPGRVDVVDLNDVFIYDEGEEWIDYVADLGEVFFDVENDDELIFRIDGAPEELNMEIDEDNLLLFSPEVRYSLEDGADIRVLAEDPEGLTAEVEFTVYIFPWQNAPDRDEGADLTFSLEGVPEELNMEIDENSVLFFNPDANFNIPNGVEIIVIAEDEDRGMSEIAFILVIESVNDAPAWIDAPDEIETDAGDIIEFMLIADDVDLGFEGDELTLRMSDDNGTGELGAEFVDNGDNTGDFSWQTGNGDAGIYSLVFEVEDQSGLSAAIEVTITIGEVLRDLTVPMSQGWNLISLNIFPPQEFYQEGEDRGPDVILMMEQLRIDEDNHHVLLMKNEDGRFYLPAFGFNNIPYWDLTEGFLVKVDEDVEAVWAGDRIPADADIPLEENWNFIAYYPTYELDASAQDFYVLSPIIDHVLIAKDGDGNFLLPAFGFSNMPPWRETLGYQVRVDADVTLNYPAMQEELAFTPPYPPLLRRGGEQGLPLLRRVGEQGSPQLRRVGNSQTALADALVCQNSHYATPALTGENMSLLVNSISGANLSQGSQVVVYSSDEKIVGSGTVDVDGRCGLAVWGDDPGTDQRDGLTEGERFELCVWDAEKSVEFAPEIVQFLEGETLTYEPDGLVVIDLKSQSQIPTEYYLASAFPNPFNSVTKISYGLPETDHVALRVFEISGRVVTELINGTQSSGTYSVSWNARDVASGVYVLRLVAGGKDFSQKVVLMR